MMLKVKDQYDYRRELCDALRSGKYKQARFERLGGRKTFWRRRPIACVLGVGYLAGLWGKSTGELYGESYHKLGMPDRQLHHMNDNGWTFPQIADYIESLP